jgi:hypothetical protein
MKGYRTILLNAALALAALTDYFVTNSALINTLLDNDPKRVALVVALINGVNILLRFITTGPVGQKQ